MKSVVFQTSSGSPDTAEWHAWRRAGIGGSDAPILAADAGLIADRPTWMKSSNHLFLVKTGQKVEEDLSNNPAVLRGKENESQARERFEGETGIIVSPCFGEMDAYDFVRASFDGMTFDQDAIVEIKVPSPKVHELAKFGKVVEYYRPQLAHQALVAWGHPEGWSNQAVFFVSYVPETDEIAIVEKSAKDYRAMAEKLLDAEIKFWDSVTRMEPPCGAEWVEAAAAYIAAHAEAEAAKTKLEAAKTKLIELLGEAKKMEGAGVSLIRSIRAGSVDYQSMLQDLMPDKSKEEISSLCDKYRKPGSDVLTVRLLK